MTAAANPSSTPVHDGAAFDAAAAARAYEQHINDLYAVRFEFLAEYGSERARYEAGYLSTTQFHKQIARYRSVIRRLSWIPARSSAVPSYGMVERSQADGGPL